MYCDSILSEWQISNRLKINQPICISSKINFDEKIEFARCLIGSRGTNYCRATVYYITKCAGMQP